MNKNIKYTGILKSPLSYAKVNREILKALCQQFADKINISVKEQKGFLYIPDFELPITLRKLINKKLNAKYNDICFIYPPTYKKHLHGQKKIAILTIESTAVPDSWINAINKHLDILIVPSNFCKEVFLSNNVNIPIKTVNFGVNLSTYNPDLHSDTYNTFTFLFIGTPHFRKGIVETIESFKKVFYNNKNVQLILKLPYIPEKSRLRPWEIPNLKKICQYSTNIKTIVSPASEAYIARLIAKSHVCVQPSYSEGFGLSILEAMAMKKLIITTCHTGHKEFVSSENALIAQSHCIESSRIQYGDETPDAKMLKPDISSLCNLFEEAYINYSSYTYLRENAYKTALKFTWEKTVTQIFKILNHL